jgi:uncharacterized protein (TIGR02453 family)
MYMDLQQILKFLTALGKHNDRVWFEKNKGQYLEAKEHFEVFITQLLAELVKFNPSLGGLDPRKLPFRIYRDVRFSKDKSPYKVNMGAGISPGGRMMQEPGYYIHLEPKKSFIAGGLYMPEPGNLAKIRQEMDYNGPSLEKIVKSKSFKKWFDGFDDFDKLKTVPKGYPKDHPRLDWLQHRSLIVSHYFTDAEVKDKKFLKQVVDACKAIKPLNDFLKEALS